MDKPKDGPLHRNGPFIRNAQAVGDGIFLCDAQRGTKGRGKVWTPTLLRPNPDAGVVSYPGMPYEQTQPNQLEMAYVKPATSQYRKGQFKAHLWCYVGGAYRSVTAYFESEALAVQFALRNAAEFIKP